MDVFTASLRSVCSLRRGHFVNNLIIFLSCVGGFGYASVLIGRMPINFLRIIFFSPTCALFLTNCLTNFTRNYLRHVFYLFTKHTIVLSMLQEDTYVVN
ncbi:hypothetical protein CQP30_00240 [Yersinia pestis]|nr:hypothetical protein EGX42_07395 [Yersinia pestis]KNC62373.1 hypothetical protein M485_1238 [Yersinia pestis 14735]QFR84912.1 hypothetical protein DJY80_08375 [Yersinia pestis subsp. pestis bv. Medievalis]AYX20319.1 hypothetical protein EGX46_13570 [Yersinia pestis]AYX25615.1 hypothetical protein EGX74_18505 [Yersinia pestis]